MNSSPSRADNSIGAACVVAMIALCHPPAWAQNGFTEDAILLTSNTAYSNRLGEDVALEGNTALSGTEFGAAYVFRRLADGSWREDQELLPTALPACGFGAAVALDAGRGAVADTFYGGGAFCDGDGVLTPYFDDGTTFNAAPNLYSPYLPAPIPQPGFTYGFGRDIAIAGSSLLVGADGNSSHTGFAGFPAAVFFVQAGNKWSQQQIVTGSDSVMFSMFGRAVALDDGGSTAVITGGSAAYVFQYDGSDWTEVQKLTAPDTVASDGFGWAVAIEGGVIAVSAPYDDAQFIDQGSVYVFRHDGTSWMLAQNFAASVPMGGGGFGTSLSLRGGQLAVGAQPSESASVYRDDGNAFLFLQTLVASAPTGTGVEWFGLSVAIDNDTCMVGAPWYQAFPFYGAVYQFTVQELALTASAAVVQAGQTVTFTTHGGMPGTPCKVTWGLARPSQPSGPGSLLFGIQTPTQGVFDSEGQHTLVRTIPLALAGSMIQMRTYGLYKPGVTGHSNPVSVLVQ